MHRRIVLPVASSHLKQQNIHKRTDPIKARHLGATFILKQLLKHRIQTPRMEIGTDPKASMLPTFAKPFWGNAVLRKKLNGAERYPGSKGGVGPAPSLPSTRHVNLISGTPSSAKSTIPALQKHTEGSSWPSHNK